MDEELRNRYRLPSREPNAAPAGPQPRQPRPTVMPPPPGSATPPTDLRPAAPLRQPDRPLPQAEFLPEPAVAPHQVRKKKRPKKLMLILVVILAGGAAGTFYIKNRHKPASAAAVIPLPADISSKVNYPIYYPSPTPDSYTYQTGSAVVQSGLVFFKLFNGSKFIFFTEQAKPTNPVNLDALPNFQRLSIPAGSAALGDNLGKPSGLIVTSSSIINVSSTGGATSEELKAIFNALTPVTKQ